jgi:hypothetical protein
MARRPYGSGSLYVKAGSWYGRWWARDQRVKRKLGAVRQPGSREGVTKAQAERELRRRIESEAPVAPAPLTLEQAGERHLHHLEHVLGRKLSTCRTTGSRSSATSSPTSASGRSSGSAPTTYGPTSGVRAARATRDSRS